MAADLNNDDKMDIVAMLVNTDSVLVVLGNGDFTFDPPVRYATGNYPNGVSISRINSDNFPDIVIANDQSNDISILAGNGNGTFQPAVQIPAANGPRAVATGDFDGDGNTDIVAVNNNSNNITVHIGNGSLTFDPPVPYALGNSTSPSDVQVAKINDDNIDDILVVLTQGHAVALLLGNGDGTFQDPAEYSTDHSPQQVMAADFNEDNVTDFATVNYSTNNVTVVLNNSAFITASGPTQICEGENLVLTATGGYSYLWNTGSQAASITITESGDYSCSVTNQAGDCTLVPPAIPVTVNPSSIIVNFNNSTPFVCEDAGEVSLQGGLPQGGVYTGPFVSNGLFSTTLSSLGTFDITYTYEDPGGCATGAATASITVEENNISITLSLPDTICTTSGVIDLNDFALPSGGTWHVNGNLTSVLDPQTWGAGTVALDYVVMSGACTGNTSAGVEIVECTATETAGNGMDWKVYPNPFEEVLFVYGENAGSTGEMWLENMLGQRVWQQKISGKKIDISFPLSPGIYLLHLPGNTVKKVVRE